MEAELEAIFLEALDKHKDSLLRVCSIYATDSEMKKDFFQEALLNIWKSLPTFKHNSSLKTWMYRITINVCLRLIKQELKVKQDFVDIESKIANYSNQKFSETTDPRLEQLQKCIAKLKESNRILIVLYLEELSYKEIANITGLTENHIAVKLKRIKKKLFNCICKFSMNK